MIKMREITISTTREGSTHDNNATIHIEANNKPVEYMAYLVPRRFGASETDLYNRDAIFNSYSAAWNSIIKGVYSRKQHFHQVNEGRRIDLDAESVYLIVTFSSAMTSTQLRKIEVTIKKNKSSYDINGMKVSKKAIGSILARIMLDVYAKTNRKGLVLTRREMTKIVYSALDTPEDIRYAIINRMPYRYFIDGIKHEARLKIMQISDNSFAIEISSDLWGTISQDNLVTLLGHYVHDKKIGSWKHLSPTKLFTRLVGREPSKSDKKLMLAFLDQNRSSKMVGDRAMSLLDDLVKQYPKRIRRLDIGNNIRIVVIGKVSDWLLSGRKTDINSTNLGPQAVSTKMLHENTEEDQTISASWGHNICINTGGKNPSLGDQFASRILSLLNDDVTMHRVYTLDKSRMEKNKSKYRVKLESDKIFMDDFNQWNMVVDDYDNLYRMSVRE